MIKISLFEKLLNRENQGKSYSLFYNDLVKKLFLLLAFISIIVTGFFGIPILPNFFITNQINSGSLLISLFSLLTGIWGLMAYREFSKSNNIILDARDYAKKIDPTIGEYEYNSYNPKKKSFERGFIPLGPIDFWDPETPSPEWLDKGKYWYLLLGLQTGRKDVAIQIVKDEDLSFFNGRKNVAITSREKNQIKESKKTDYKFIVKVPQWIVMNTEMSRYIDDKTHLGLDWKELISIIYDLNKKITMAADEIIEREKQRIAYPWFFNSVLIYIVKSLPVRLVYREFLEKIMMIFPAAKIHSFEKINKNLAYVKDDDLIKSIIELAKLKKIPSKNIDKISILMNFLKRSYDKIGLGEGSLNYHNFHHSLEVAYMGIYLLPKEIHGHEFYWNDYELILIAGLLHDYDTQQSIFQIEDNNNSNKNGKEKKRIGPSVERTIAELDKTKIVDAYFTMDYLSFLNYFREYPSSLLPYIEYNTIHPEYIKDGLNLLETKIIKILIWRTDFPFHKKTTSQQIYHKLLNSLIQDNVTVEKYKILSEVLSLSDLSVTYLSSDPIRAWDRVQHLYNELNIPKSEAIIGTDRFFSDFVEMDLFQTLIKRKTFPLVFKNRWNLVYQFYHEGNPSTQINRLIQKANNSYNKINLQIGLEDNRFLFELASIYQNEYFIGIGTNQIDVFLAKEKFSELESQNATSVWGNPHKLLPNILKNSLHNIIILLKNSVINSNNNLDISVLTIVREKLTKDGTIQIITPNTDIEFIEQLIMFFVSLGYKYHTNSDKKLYIPSEYISQKRDISVLVFTPS